MSRIEAILPRRTEEPPRPNILQEFLATVLEEEAHLRALSEKSLSKKEKFLRKRKIEVSLAYCQDRKLAEISQELGVNHQRVSQLAYAGRKLLWQYLSFEAQARFPLEEILARRQPSLDSLLERKNRVTTQVLQVLKETGNIRNFKEKGITSQQLAHARTTLSHQGFDVSSLEIKKHHGCQEISELNSLTEGKTEEELLSPLLTSKIQEKLDRFNRYFYHYCRKQSPPPIVPLKNIVYECSTCNPRKFGHLVQLLRERGIPIGQITHTVNTSRYGELTRSYYFTLSVYQKIIIDFLPEILENL